MPLEIINSGRISWYGRKYLSALAGNAFLRLQYAAQHKTSRRYIDHFLSQATPPLPLDINIETYNRCNNTCRFCPANKVDDTRPEKTMSESLFRSIVRQIKEMGFSGTICLFLNNEPLLDDRIHLFCEHVKTQLPGCELWMFTNGILLTEERLKLLAPHLDRLTVNNYSSRRRILPNIKKIIDHVSNNKTPYKNLKIVVSLRYAGEVLSNRAGQAPNKNTTDAGGSQLCLSPFTDLTIYPDGRVGLCCSDAMEKHSMGDLNVSSVLEVWQGKPFREVREALSQGRGNHPFCMTCDFIDAGHRVDQIKKRLNW